MKVMILLVIVLAGYVSCEDRYRRCVLQRCQRPDGDQRVCSNQGRTYPSMCHLTCSPEYPRYEWKESDGACSSPSSSYSCEPVCTWEWENKSSCDADSWRCKGYCPCEDK